MSILESLRKRLFGPARPRPIRKRRPRVLEQLEDRTVPATLYVDNTPIIGGPGADEFTPSGGTQTTQTGLTLNTDLFTTIQDAIDVAVSGDVINVADGTYSENLIVSVPLTIRGNQFGVSGVGRSATETIVDGGFGTAMTVSASGSVVVDGLTLDGDTGVAGDTAAFTVQNNVIGSVSVASYGINLSSPATVDVFDNAITSVANGASIYDATGAVTVQGNSFLGDFGSVGLDVYNPGGALLIGGSSVGQGNTFAAAPTVPVFTWGIAINVGSAADATIAGNTVTDALRGIWLANVGSVGDRAALDGNVLTTSLMLDGGLVFDGAGVFALATANDVSGFQWGIYSQQGADSVIEENFITGNDVGIRIDDDGPVTALGNDLSGNVTLAVDNIGIVNVVDASGNWFGTTSETAVLASTGGLVDITPYLESGSDTSVSAGLQGDFSDLYVTALGDQVGATPRIQEGYEFLSGASLTLRVLSGTYAGAADFGAGADKAVTIVTGASPGRVVLGGNLTLTSNDSFPVEIEGTNPLTPDYDNWVVTGSVTLGSATLPALTGTHVPAVGEIFTIIDNDTGGDAVSGIFAGLPAGSVVTLNAQPLKIFYTGNDGNDVILASAIVSTMYVDDAWGSLTIGDFIADADLGTAGNQPAVYGLDAFATFAAGMPYLSTSGTVIVNDGAYAETVSLTGTQTMDVTGPDVAGVATIGGISTVAGTTINIEGSSTLIAGDTGTYVIAGVVNGSGSFVKTGTGTLTLSGANAYSGGTTLRQGTLVHANDLATGATTAPIAVNDASTGANATTLRFTAGVINSNVSTTYKPITVANFGTTTTFEFNQGTDYVNASLAIAKAITITTTAAGTQNGLMGAISGAGAGAGNTSVTFANTGGGTFSYTAGYSGGGVIANTFLGNVVVAGNVSLTNLAYVNAAYVNGVIPDASSVSISSGATWTQASGAESLDALSGSGTLANGGFAITLGASSGTGNFAGVMSGAGSLVKNGTGTQTLSGATANTYTGATTINDGTLVLGKTSGIASIAGPGAVTIGDGSGAAASAILQINAGEQIANTIDVTLGGADAQLYANLPTGQAETVAPINQLNVPVNDFRGGDVKVGGTGTLVIAGDYVQGAVGDTPGTTTMAGGVLKVGSTGGVVPATGGINFYYLNTGSLVGAGTITTGRLINDTAINPGDAVAAGKITIQGNLDLTANSVVTLNVNGTGTVTYDQIAVTLNGNIAATKPSTATPFTNGAVFFRGSLNTGSIGAVPSNLTNYANVMTFVYRLLNTDTAAAAMPAGATNRQPSDFNYKNLNQAGPGVRFEPRFVNASGGVNALSQASNNNGALYDPTLSIGAAKSMSLTALTNLATQVYTIDLVRGSPTTNTVTRHQNQILSLKNTSASPIAGPLYLELDVTVGANMRLFNKAGLTYVGGKSYVVVTTGDLAAGATATVQLEWANPDFAPFEYATSYFSGGLPTGIYSPGSSPGGSAISSFTMNGGDAFIFELANATGTAGSVNGWDTVTVAPTPLNPISAQVHLNATPANKYVIFVDSFVNDGIGHTAGPAANFNPAQSYAWKFLDGSHPMTTWNGTFNPASINVVTTRFQNSFTGTFTVEQRDGGKNLYLVYTAPAVSAVVTGVAAFIGPTSGGNTVVISGSGFSGVSAVQFGGVNATNYTVLSPTQITAVVPAGSSTVNVTVVNSVGPSSTAGTADDYTYAPPAITSVVVNGGAIIARNRFGAPELASQNSVVTQILVTFNQPVTLDAGAFAIASRAADVNTAGAAASAADVTVIATGVDGTGDGAGAFSRYVLTFAEGSGVDVFDYTSVGGNRFTTLQDGLYRLDTIGSKVHAGISDTAADRSDTFWSIFGAGNAGADKTTGALGDGDDTVAVDGLALSDVYRAFGSSADASSNYDKSLDWNLDGYVDGVDLSRLYANFGTIWRF